MATANQNSGRAAALARRKAMSGSGKAAVSGQGGRVRAAPERKATVESVAEAKPSSVAGSAPTAPVAARRPRSMATAPVVNVGRSAALARRKMLSSKGKTTSASADRTRDNRALSRSKLAMVKAEENRVEAEKPTGDCRCGCGGKGKPEATTGMLKAKVVDRSRKAKKTAKSVIANNPGKAAALARRKAQSTRGKAGLSAAGMSQAQTARAVNPELSSRELAQAVREARNQRGGAGQKKTRPTGRVRPQPEVGGATDQPWKVGASETVRGQTVTGTMVNRDKDVTGNEASTCRDITGTEYMGADVFREFCQAEPQKQSMRGGVTATASGQTVTGNEVGRSAKVTGDEPGTCKNITGTEYVAAGQSEAFCNQPSQPAVQRITTTETRKGMSVTGDNVGNSPKVTGGEAGAQRELTGAQYVKPTQEPLPAPAKVRHTETLRGGSVTGTAVGRSEKTTGDEYGACRSITGDDYIGQEQFKQFCGAEMKPGDAKVGVSATFGGMAVSGTMEGRSQRVTGNEPGTCKAITGTPYFGMENYAQHCAAPATQNAAARMTPSVRASGMNMTGQQPAIGGVMTGDEKGACEEVTGTPYVGADQAAQVCPATPAEPGNSDFPQAVGDTTGWSEFSVTPPSHAAAADENTGVTGSRYEVGNNITGPFGMAGGKVTGTENARFGGGLVNSSSVNEEAEEPQEIAGRVKSRITGEGQDAGQRITGDDWARGERVTGTEGSSALVRNPSMRGPMNAMVNKRISDVKNEAPQPISRVTGSSGNYENGSLITYSGGARG